MAQHYLLYGHGGSYNHGGEALTRTTISLLRRIAPECRIILSSHFPDQDKECGLYADGFVTRNLDGRTNEAVYASTLKQVFSDSVCIHLGGDNYCYKNWQRYAAIHNRALEVGATSILWSCSIDPEVLDAEMLTVLRSHHLIAARESITYNALIKRGLDNVVQVSDIAFTLEPEPVDFTMCNFVAINASPLVFKRNPMVKAAFQSLLDYILIKTDLNVALVPHVLTDVDNDCDAMRALRVDNQKRVEYVSGRLTAGQYKYVISNARFGVFARTHGAIAAYSSLVPALAVGYSCKSRGIAGDLGLSDYVLDVEHLSDVQDITRAFIRLMENETIIRKKLSDQMPLYIQRAVHPEILNFLIKEKKTNEQNIYSNICL